MSSTFRDVISSTIACSLGATIIHIQSASICHNRALFPNGAPNIPEEFVRMLPHTGKK